MAEKKVMTLSEFKTVVESFQSDLKKMSEAIQSVQSKVDHGFQYMHEQFTSVKEQVALLHEGQTEIKNELKQKVSRDEFSRLELRVAKLENKAA
jgi:methyl-accepting chemotaxis protein